MTLAAPEPRFGCMLLQNGLSTPLPLEHTDVVAQITGPIASVSVTQRFGNPFQHPIELRYLFPLPHDAAVFAFEIRVGGRVAKSRVEEEEVARKAYEEASRSGRRAGLIEQRRPNLFALELANVQPHESIVAVVRYQERVRYDDGAFTFVFPMGVTPKYHNHAQEGEETSAPIAGANEPIGTVDLTLGIDAGAALRDPVSPSHAVESSRLDERRVSVRTAGEIIPNKDFVLRYEVAEEDVAAAAWLAKGETASTALIQALPPRMEELSLETPARDFVFVIDRSGSMSIEPMRQAKNALRASLRTLSDRDRFEIVAFDDRIEALHSSLQAATQRAISAADAWLDGIDARGGTELRMAIREALTLAASSERIRYVILLTDGAVSSERETLTEVRGAVGDTRVFTIGIGPSVNRALLSEMAVIGRGVSDFLQTSEDIEGAMIRMQDRLTFPVLQDIAIEWRGAKVWDVVPEKAADLYHGQSLELSARVQLLERDASVVVTAKRAGVEWRREMPLPQPIDEPAITRLWAKSRVDAIKRHDSGAATREKILSLALQHQLVTEYTSLVAIDEEVTTGGEATRVQVALPLPEGVMEAPLMRMRLSAPAAAPMPIRASLASFGLDEEALEERSVAYFSKGTDVSGRRLDEDPLRVLARSQNASGSWGSGDAEIEQTAAAILAFVRRGETTRRGMYRRHLQKAVKWLLATRATGDAAVARAVALAEMGSAIGDDTLASLRDGVSLPPLPDAVLSVGDVRAYALHGRVAGAVSVESFWNAAAV